MNRETAAIGAQPETRIAVVVGQDELLDVNRLRIAGRIVQGAVHDTNNALQIIGGAAELLALRDALGPAEQRRIHTIASQTGRVSTIVGRLSAFTRPVAPEHQIVDLWELVETAVALCDFTLSRSRVAVTVNREQMDRYLAAVDRRQILQAFLNLLLNGEAACANRPDARIDIRIGRLGHDFSVSFIDNGPGITAEEKGGAAVPNLGPGLSGLGLWVSARIAEQHGGRLEFFDTPAAGTSVRLLLPAASVP
jgi:two-component system C4-dicarboxylate transport sensor histidine kinase DctB